MPERFRSAAARDLVRAVRAADGTVERTRGSMLKITGPLGSITLKEPAAETRRDLRRDGARRKIAEATGLRLEGGS